MLSSLVFSTLAVMVITMSLILLQRMSQPQISNESSSSTELHTRY